MTKKIKFDNICLEKGNKNDIITISGYKGGYLCSKCYGEEYKYNLKTLKLIKMFYYVNLDSISKIEVSDLIKNDKVVMYLYSIFRDRKVGVYAQQNLYIVELWNPVKDQENTYKARKILTTAVLSGKTPNPGETITFNGDLKGIGDFVDGTFDTSTKKFTPNA